jgi:hypothetical protein
MGRRAPGAQQQAYSSPAPIEPGPKPRSRKLSLAKRLAFSLLGILVALALAEGLLRLLSPVQLGFEYADGKFSAPVEFTIDRTANRLGFHDVEPVPIRLQAKRILLLGDSYVHACSVPIPSTVGRRLEHHLQNSSAGSHQVIACGRSGWGQREQLTVLQRLGPTLRPGLVVTLFVPFNDVSDNWPELRAKARAQLSTLMRARPGWLALPADEAPCFYLRASRLNQLISHRLALLSASKDKEHIPLEYSVYSLEPDAIWTDAWAATEDLILRTRDICKDLGAGYVLVSASTPHGVWGAKEGLEQLARVYPAMRDLEWDLDRPNARLAKLCRQHGIPFLSLEPRFREETVEEGRRLHWKYDGHWNVEGNDLAGKLTADFILKLDSAD